MSLEIGAHTRTFLDRPAVMRHLTRMQRQALARGGGLVRKIARDSIRPARRLSLAELSPDQRALYERRRTRARRKGRPPPKRPFAPGVPGEPPRNRTGLLKRLIFFGFDTAAQKMLVGPAAAGPRTAAALEYGGTASLPGGRAKGLVRFAGNPFMRPALVRAAPKLTDPFRNAFGG